MTTIPVSFVVLTANEELNLEACLDSVKGLVAEMFVVDSGSTDRTLEIAAAAGAHVVEHPFTTHAEQWTWALAHLPLASDWVLGLDADQRVTADLASELRDRFLEHPAELSGLDGFYVNRRQIFRGTWIRHGGYYPKYLLKLFRNGAVRIDTNERLDHHFSVARASRLHHDIIESNAKEDSIGFWLEKHIRYADLLADEAVNQPARATVVEARGLRDPADRARVLKSLWRFLPRYWRGLGFFFYRYVVRLGFLDGKQAFIFHFLQSCWFRIVVDVMIEEKQAAGAAAAGS